ncbi:hypothetical protein [Microbacterium xylanilyticum]
MKAAQTAKAARTAADAAATRADELTTQATAAERTAQEAHEQVGALIADRARTETSSPLPARLFTTADPDELLTRLGVMQRLDATWATLSERAISEQAVADSLRDQAQAARAARDQLATSAEQAARQAQAAADAETAAVRDLQGHITTL